MDHLALCQPMLGPLVNFLSDVSTSVPPYVRSAAIYLAPYGAERPDRPGVSGGGGGNADDDEDEVGGGEVDHQEAGCSARSTVLGDDDDDQPVADDPRQHDQSEQRRNDDRQQHVVEPVHAGDRAAIVVVNVVDIYSQPRGSFIYDDDDDYDILSSLSLSLAPVNNDDASTNNVYGI